ncbi:hypothetical protein [Streptomyces sp. NPDC048665]|uniref:hypothetical protein n=1 Tax=unclassified Streptomyces TaxID=2593676 RepID=UPI0034192EBA
MTERRRRRLCAAVALVCLIAVVAGWALRHRSHTYDAAVPGDVPRHAGLPENGGP